MLPKINIVWLKRDLRLTDHLPLLHALAAKEETLLLYIVEPILLEDPHYSERHWRFVWQSLQDINQQLAKAHSQLVCLHCDAETAFQRIQQYFHITQVFSHEEIGLANTFERDKAMQRFFDSQQITWTEFPSGAVIRGSKNRTDWDKHWAAIMRTNIEEITYTKAQLVCRSKTTVLNTFKPPTTWTEKARGIQTGGPTLAWQTLHDFYAGRGQRYAFCLSKPQQSRSACSRLSPYLAWGNISLRETYQALLAHWKVPGWRRSLAALSSRLHWHCHFIQKFESESRIEFSHLNAGYNDFPYRNDAQVVDDLNAWKTGKTGIPLIDACMRCLLHTGYINFRMRAMLVSFLTHHLNIDWRLGVAHLASLFLDFEPGIHYAQFQMQAGVTGINTIRIYNPIKQAQEHDPTAEFIKRWLPELAELPPELALAPWEITAMERSMYQVDTFSFPTPPIIDVEQAAKSARDRLWQWRKKPQVKAHIHHILKRHVRITNTE